MLGLEIIDQVGINYPGTKVLGRLNIFLDVLINEPNDVIVEERCDSYRGKVRRFIGRNVLDSSIAPLIEASSI